MIKPYNKHYMFKRDNMITTSHIKHCKPTSHDNK